MMLGIGGRTLPTVLIIDDDLISREVMATILTMTGYTVHTAESGVEALGKIELETCRPEVVLLDAQMPGLNGVQLAGLLRSKLEARIYIISGSQPGQELIEAADGFLMKPVSPDALQQLIRQQERIMAPAPPAEPVVLDATVVEQLRALMPEPSVQQIYDSLEADLDKRIASLRVAWQSGDVESVRRLGHSLKGGCGMAGATQIARLGELLESGGDQSDNTRAILDELDQAALSLHRMLDAAFPTRKSGAGV